MNLLLRRLLGVVLVAGLAGSSTVSRAGGLDALHTFVNQFQSARGEFTQKATNGRKTTESSGQFIFARPGKFRWTYLKPYEQVIVADGDKLTIFDHDLNQVTVRKLTDALGSTPAAILFGDNALEKSFDLKDAGSHDGLDWLEAIPKSHDTTFQKIDIAFRQGELAAMELHDALGQTTQLRFTNVERNVPVNADTFRFVPPKGADVLEN
ncbi:MAG: outer membrane lipoprotein chaperone LolA [Burkholderiaceae bacterium]